MASSERVSSAGPTQAALLGIYTLTPTHCGTGKAMDAVDLPIAREGHTLHPILPSSSVKGALRSASERAGWGGRVRGWFGPELRAGQSDELEAGNIVFTDARLLAFPVRALHTAFCWVTCPLILERFYRDLLAFDAARFWPSSKDNPLHPSHEDWDGHRNKVRVAEHVTGGALVLEDLVFSSTDLVVQRSGLGTLAQAFGALLGPAEGGTRKRFTRDLVVLPDADFADLVVRTMPVQARIRLNDKKTTSGDGGNLWYEETLPADALLSVFALARDGARGADTLTTLIDAAGRPAPTSNAGAGKSGNPGKPAPAATGAEAVDQSGAAAAADESVPLLFSRPIQIGGNETVGQGFCLWHVAQEVRRGR
jgi:CRISPR-associated protein Cmr4